MNKARLKLLGVIILIAAFSITMAACDLDDPDPPTAEEMTIIVEVIDADTGEELENATVAIVDDEGSEQTKDEFTDDMGYVFEDVLLVENESYSVEVEHEDYEDIETDFVAEDNKTVEVALITKSQVSDVEGLREALEAEEPHITFIDDIEEAEDPFLVDYEVVFQAEEGESFTLTPEAEITDAGTVSVENDLTLTQIELLEANTNTTTGILSEENNADLSLGINSSAGEVTTERSARITGASNINTLTANAEGVSLDGDPDEIEGTHKDDVVIEHEMRLIDLTGSGYVEVENEDIDFTLESETESGFVEEDVEIKVTAEPYPGWEFDDWSEDAAGQNEASFTTTIDSVYEIGVAFGEEPEPAEAELSNLDIAGQNDEASIVVGEDEDVSVTVTNEGEESEAFDVTLEIGNEIEETETTDELSQDEDETIKFEEVTGDLAADDYSVNVSTKDDTITGSLTVQEPANFAVEIDEDESDEEVATGGRLDVTASITNTGDVEGTQDIVLDFGEETVTQQTVNLSGGQSQVLELSYDVPENYDIGNDEDAVNVTLSSDNDEDSYQVDVKDVEPASFNITDMDVDPQEVYLGEKVTIDTTVENSGGLFDTQDINLTVFTEDGVEIESSVIEQNLKLEGGDTENIEYDYDAPEEEGTYTLQISSADDEVSTDLTAEKEVYDLTFEVVENDNDNFIEDATVDVAGVGSKDTDTDGEVEFEDVEPGTYNYEVTHEGYEDVSDSVNIVDGDIEETVEMTAVAFYEITDIDIPDQVYIGETMNLKAAIENTGYAEGEKDIGAVLFIYEYDDEKGEFEYEVFDKDLLEDVVLESEETKEYDDEEEIPDESFWDGREWKLKLITGDKLQEDNLEHKELDDEEVDDIKSHEFESVEK